MAECTCIICKKEFIMTNDALVKLQGEIIDLKRQLQATDTLIERLLQGKLK